MLRVKICGLMRAEDVAACVSAGAHALGFVTEYPVPVPWNLTEARAKELIDAVPPFVTSCMVTAGSAEKVLSLARRVRPDIVQLHGDETLEETAVIAAELKKIGILCIRALRVDKTGRLRFSISQTRGRRRGNSPKPTCPHCLWILTRRRCPAERESKPTCAFMIGCAKTRISRSLWAGGSDRTT